MRYDLQIQDMVWSYSRLTTFEDCPYQWREKYINHQQSEEKFFAQYGSLMHSVLQKILTGELGGDDIIPYYLNHFLTDIIVEAPSEKISLSYLEQGRQYLQNLSFPPRAILNVEKEIRFTFAGYPFVGFPDVLTADDDWKLYITDHKSRILKPRSKRKKPTKSDAELDKYLRQLYIYAQAVREYCGRYPDYLEFNCFRSRTWICEQFSLNRMQEVEKWAGRLIEQITANDDWEAKPNYWYCRHLCGYSGTCEYADRLNP